MINNIESMSKADLRELVEIQQAEQIKLVAEIEQLKSDLNTKRDVLIDYVEYYGCESARRGVARYIEKLRQQAKGE